MLGFFIYPEGSNRGGIFTTFSKTGPREAQGVLFYSRNKLIKRNSVTLSSWLATRNVPVKCLGKSCIRVLTTSKGCVTKHAIAPAVKPQPKRVIPDQRSSSKLSEIVFLSR